MSANSNIEWTDSTWNPWEGCTKVGPGCDNCYAESRNARFGGGISINWGPGAPRRRTSEHNWNEPRRWNAKADAFMAAHGRRQRVFCASLADVFDNEIAARWRTDLFALIAETPSLDWLLLTKRIGNVRRMVPMEWLDPNGWPAHVWLGATIVNQTEADRDIPKLLDVPARVRFLSMEPLLAPVNLHPWLCAYGDANKPDQRFGSACTRAAEGINWIIVGGESGPNARPMHPDWARSLRDQCEAAGVPFLFKQWGEWAPHPPTPGFDEGGALRSGHVRYLQGEGREPDGHFRRGDAAVRRVGKKAAGRLLNGRTWDGCPGDATAAAPKEKP